MTALIPLKGKSLVYAITSVCASAFCLFGYDNGLMGVIISEKGFLDIIGHPNSSLLGFVVSCYDVGCMVSALCCVFFGDRYGRRKMIFAGCVLHILGSIITTAAFSIGQVIASRVIIGFGMGIFTSTCPVWLAESADAHTRAVMVAVELTSLIIGTAIAFWFDFGMSFVRQSVSWRLPFAFQMVFSFFALIMTIYLPDSPRWLLSKGKREEAVKVLALLRDLNETDEPVQAEVHDIEGALIFERENAGSWASLFQKKDNSRALARICVSSAAQAMQALSGINFIEYYFPFILKNSVRLSPNTANIISGCSQIWYLLCSFLTWWLINRLGRRRLFFLGSIGMGTCMMVFTICLWKNTRPAAETSVAFLFIYLSFFTWGWMSNLWTYPAEILPLQYRSKGLGFSVFALWAFQFWTVEIAPVSIDNIGWKTYIIWTVLNFGCLLIAYFFFPETSGMTLEAVDFMFNTEGSFFDIVRKSDKMFRSGVSWDVGMAQEVAYFDFDGEKKAQSTHLD